MANPRQELQNFLLHAFSTSELIMLVAYHLSEGNQLRAELPEHASLSTFAYDLIELVERRGLRDEFFAALKHERAFRIEEIERIESLFEPTPIVSFQSEPTLTASVVSSGRPMLYIRDGSFAAESPWAHLANQENLSGLQFAIRAVCRIEVPTLRRMPYLGTGFHIGEGKIVTARHVAETFVEGVGDRTPRLRPGTVAGAHFSRELQVTATPFLPISSVLTVDTNWDFAVFQLDLSDGDPPLALSLDPADPANLKEKTVVVIGHPERDMRWPQQIVDTMFDHGGGWKRIEPGKVIGLRSITSFGRRVELLAHDATTMGGCGGAPVISLETGKVIGVQIASVPLEAGYSVPATHVIDSIRDLETSCLRSDGLESRSTPVVSPIEETLEWDDTRDPERLEESLAQGNIDETTAVLKRLRTHLETWDELMDVDVSTRVLKSLRRHANFGALVEFGSRIRKAGQDDYQVGLEYVRGLVEAGQATDAILELDALSRRLEKELENLDTRGRPEDVVRSETLKRVTQPDIDVVKGEAYKQLYLDATPNQAEPRKEDRDRAAALFKRAYKANASQRFRDGVESYVLAWHGELVDKCDEHSSSLRSNATSLVELMQEMPTTPDILAARAQAQFLSGKNQDACKTVEALLEHGDTDAYILVRLDRQLSDLIGLSDREGPGKRILPQLRARLAQLSSSLEIPQPPADFEAVWGNVSYKPLQWLVKALKMSRCVARIGRSAFAGSGTGFRFDGRWIGQQNPGSLVLTNAHVMSPDQSVVDRYRPLVGTLTTAQATSTFFGDDGTPIIEAAKTLNVIKSSPPEQLDYTLVRVDSNLDGVPIPQKEDGAIAEGDRVNVIGHPNGGQKSVSLQDNRVVRVQKGDRPRVFYKTPTDPGSSGSPVFDNAEWRVVALHHAGPQDAMANRGIPLSAILKDLRQ